MSSRVVVTSARDTRKGCQLESFRIGLATAWLDHVPRAQAPALGWHPPRASDEAIKSPPLSSLGSFRNLRT